MDIFHAFIIAIIEGITEYLPISSTAHMGFVASILGLEETAFLKMFQVSIQFGAILSIVVLYWRKFFDFTQLNFYLKLILAVIPALILGKLFNERIEEVLENQKVISLVLVLGGIVLIFIDRCFKNLTIDSEKKISIKMAIIIGFWQCLAMMPGTSRSAASIIGGMSQKLTKKVAAEFSFFLAVPTMFAVTFYSLFIKGWGEKMQTPMKGYEMIFSSSNHVIIFVIGNVVSFLVALATVKFFIGFITKYGFKFWGWYRIVIGLILFFYFTFIQK